MTTEFDLRTCDKGTTQDGQNRGEQRVSSARLPPLTHFLGDEQHRLRPVSAAGSQGYVSQRPISSRLVGASHVGGLGGRVNEQRRHERARVHDSIMALDSPSYSRKGSWGNDKILKVFDVKFKTPGPGSYNCRYGVYSFKSSRPPSR